MKLIIMEYLASLKERGELDAILPDLLSQLGLNVFSRPARGTRQNGVDVGAVGSLKGEPERVFLFTIKPGDLSRTSWNDGPQSVRPSLDEIQDAYIPNRLPTEHRDKEVVICMCCGGDIQEQVREQWEGYISQRTKGKLSFQEWNGGRLADYIQEVFLREDLLPAEARSMLRKALAMLDQPDVSYKHFARLIGVLSSNEGHSDAQNTLAIRQIVLSIWILLAWARKSGDLEAAFLCGELALLHAWHIARTYAGKSTKAAYGIMSAFFSAFSAYEQISSLYLTESILPHVDKLHGLSSAVRAGAGLDINLKLFDVLGRVALRGIWHYWQAGRISPDQNEDVKQQLESANEYAFAICRMIANNPALLSPIKEDQAIDIALALFLLSANKDRSNDMQSWMSDIFKRCRFSYVGHGKYPCILRGYAELLDHPERGDDEYRREATAGSILYPVLAFWSAMRGFDRLYGEIGQFQKESLEHCNFQVVYPDSESEGHIYTDSGPHGAVLSDLQTTEPKESFLAAVFAEVEGSPHFKALSAIEHRLWPMILMACRHHRFPVPLDFFRNPATTKSTPNDDASPESHT